MANNEKDVVN